MQIFVKTLTEKTITLMVEPSYTIADVKLLIEATEVLRLFGGIQIRHTTRSGRIVPIEVENDIIDILGGLNQELRAREIGRDQLVIIYAGERLHDDLTLAQCNIQVEDHLTVCLRGGSLDIGQQCDEYEERAKDMNAIYKALLRKNPSEPMWGLHRKSYRKFLGYDSPGSETINNQSASATSTVSKKPPAYRPSIDPPPTYGTAITSPPCFHEEPSNLAGNEESMIRAKLQSCAARMKPFGRFVISSLISRKQRS